MDRRPVGAALRQDQLLCLAQRGLGRCDGWAVPKRLFDQGIELGTSERVPPRRRRARGVDRDLIELADAFGFRSGRERLVKVLLPAATPGILVGLRTALGQAWMAVVAAELSGVSGLGARMMQASSLLATDIVVVYMLTMAVLYGVMDAAFVFAQTRLLRWKA